MHCDLAYARSSLFRDGNPNKGLGFKVYGLECMIAYWFFRIPYTLIPRILYLRALEMFEENQNCT